MLSLTMSSKGSGITKTLLRDITPSTPDNVFIVGIIIAKRSPHNFLSKKDGIQRGVFNFTFRDSPGYYVNVAVWGSADYVNHISQEFHIGDVVDVINPKPNFNKLRDQENKFHPAVTCAFQLTVNENHGDIKLHDIEDSAKFQPLLRIPTQPPADFLLLQDIHANSDVLKGKFVNILVALQSLSTIRQITNKDGKKIETREVYVMDQSHSKLLLQMWDADDVYRAENWTPRETILFIADLRVDWNEYRKTMCGTVSSRTIITENPSINEAEELKIFARTAPIKPRAVLSQLALNYPDPGSITTVMSCRSVWKKATSGDVGTESFTALVYAALHQFDIDGLRPISVTKCKYCGQSISEEVLTCLNADCSVQSTGEVMESETMFNIPITLADHTGSVSNCHLTPNAAENLLKCSVAEFESYTDDKKTAMKWEYLLRQCKARLLVLPASRELNKPLFSVISLEKVNSKELAANMPMF